MAAWSRKERGEVRRVKPREESKKKETKRERRVKGETEAREKEWTERKGKEHCLQSINRGTKYSAI